MQVLRWRCIDVLDIKIIRENPDLVRRNLVKRGDEIRLRMLDELIGYDKEWRQSLTQANELRHRRREITVEIAELKKAGKDPTREKFVSAMETLQEFPVGGLMAPLTYGPNLRKGAHYYRILKADYSKKLFVPASDWRRSSVD
jgi:hypothetical protein